MSPPDETRGGAAGEPVRLDYFAAQEPDRVASRGVTTSAVLLLASWGPYLCGVVNAATVAKSYVPAITTAHVNASVLFLALGLIMAGVSLVRFLRVKHYPGAIIAGAVVMIQALIAGCIGLA
ncbi:MAG: hypothetical protein WBD40_23765 [Tepidisphaeraceae bacterium]